MVKSCGVVVVGGPRHYTVISWDSHPHPSPSPSPSRLTILILLKIERAKRHQKQTGHIIRLCI